MEDKEIVVFDNMLDDFDRQLLSELSQMVGKLPVEIVPPKFEELERNPYGE